MQQVTRLQAGMLIVYEIIMICLIIIQNTF